MQTALLAVTVVPALTSVISAQGAPVAVEGPIRHFTHDYATGEVREVDPALRTPVPAAFDNASCATIFYAQQGFGAEWLDWGVKATSLGTGLITEFTIGFGTTELDTTVGGPGASLGVNIYTGTLGSCAPGALVGSYSFPVLPGSLTGSATGIVYSVDISSAAILVPDGPLGWGFVQTGPPDVTGPIYMTVGGCPSGTVDLLDIYTSTPATAATCSMTCSLLGMASFYFSMSEDDGFTPASATFRNTTNPADYAVTGPPKLGASLGATVTLDPAGLPISLVLIGLASNPGSPNPLGQGELLVGLAPFPLIDASTGSHTIPIPNDPTLNGVLLYSQGFRTAFGALGSVTFDALNAYDLVLGT